MMDVRMRYVTASALTGAGILALLLWGMFQITDYKTILTASVLFIVLRLVAEKTGIELWIQNKMG
jgi:hypothetical protein